MSNESNDRSEVLALKKELASHLGENATEYWDCLRSFIIGKVSKIELDLIAREYLQDKHGLNIHNSFLKAILHNAMKDNAPTGERSSGFVADASRIRRSKQRVTDENLRRLQRKREIMSLSKSDRLNIRSLSQKRKIGKPPVAPSPPAPQRLLPSNPPIVFMPEILSCCESGELPSLDILRARIKSKVIEAGMMSQSEDAVRLIMFALEYHIKNIVANYVKKIKPFGEKMLRLGSLSSDVNLSRLPATEAAFHRNQKHAVRMRDLLLSLEVSPHLLGEGQVHIEKMTQMLTE